MKQRFALILPVIFAALLSLYACTNGNNSDPLGNPPRNPGPPSPPGAGATPITLVALNNGVLGTYNGVTLIAASTAGVTFGLSGIADPIAGTPNSSRLVAGTNAQADNLTLSFCPWGTTGCVSNLFPYMSQLLSSKIDFDLMLETPLNEINNVYIYFGPDNCKAGYSIPLATLSTTSFVHYSFRGSAFYMNGCQTQSAYTATVFQINLLRSQVGTSPASLLINNVTWTP